MLRFIQYRGQVVLASKPALHKILKRMKEHADFAKRLSEQKEKEEKK